MIKRLLFCISYILLTAGCTSSVQVSKAQLEGVRQAAEKVLPYGAQVSVSVTHSDIVIAAHLLEGHSADENSPYVVGDYGTHDKLERLVRFRCAKILKSLVSEAQVVPDVKNFVIEARHGVRVTRVYGNAAATPGSGIDEAMTIYIVKMPASQLKDPQWPILTDDQVMSRWREELDIIPSLKFSSAYF
ncbi:MAG: hypothetical protein WCL43_05730 [Chlorobium sp.]|jgi:hypothetical protein|nr:MAG: hypothetical protein FDX12_09885 [Chlorobium sp.]